MNILLLNDNPVVRKLVALSAQKTKDELSVVWSVDEVEGDAYDLLIVDDANYSDESMAALKEKIQYKTSLLMATRGNATPAGFDKVINKPFLPTDLVDLFSQIAKDLSSSTLKVSEEKGKAIVLDDVLENALSEDEDIQLDDFEIEDDDVEVKTNVLDHEEVQELQDLLNDTDHFDIDDELSLDSLTEDDEITDSDHIVENDDLLESLDDEILETLGTESSNGSTENDLEDAMEEFDFDEEVLLDEKGAEKADEDEDLLGSLDELLALDEELDDMPVVDEEKAVVVADETFDDEDLTGSLDELLALDEEPEDLTEVNDEKVAMVEEETTIDEELDDLDSLLLEALDEDETLAEEVTDDALTDDEFGELEQQIQEAVEELGVEDLEQSFDDVEMEDLGDFEGLGDLDSLNERDIKLAIGEEVEEEPEVSIDDDILDEEVMNETVEESPIVELDDELENINMDVSDELKSVTKHQGTPAEGVDALQALLKALANEEVAKTLKGLSINININFGNEK